MRCPLMMVALLPLGVCTSAFAATPSSGSLTDTNPKVTYTGGPYAIPNVTDQLNGNGFPTCDATNPAEQCDMFTLNVNVAAGDASTKQIRITDRRSFQSKIMCTPNSLTGTNIGSTPNTFRICSFVSTSAAVPAATTRPLSMRMI